MSEKILTWFQLLNALKLVLWSKIWSNLDNVACALENMYSSVFECSVFYISARYNWFVVWFKPSISLLIFQLVILSTIDSAVLKSQTINGELTILPSIFPFLLHIFSSSGIRCMFAYNCNIFLMSWNFYQYIMTLSPTTFFDLKLIFFSNNNIGTSAFFGY